MPQEKDINQLTALEFLDRFRNLKGEPEQQFLDRIKRNPEKRGYKIVDKNSDFRWQVASEIEDSSFNEADRRLLRNFITEEMKSEDEFDTGALKYYCYLLYKIGNVKDSILIYHVKCSDMDLSCGMDIELVLGAGYSKTIAYLKSQSTRRAKTLLEDLESRFERGELDWFLQNPDALEDIIYF